MKVRKKLIYAQASAPLVVAAMGVLMFVKSILENGSKPRFNNQGFRDGLLHLKCTDEIA